MLSGPAGRGRQRSFQHTFRGAPPSSGNTPKWFLKAAQNAHFPSAGKSHMRVRIPTSKRRHKRVSSGGTSWLWWLLLSGPTLNRWRGQLWKVGPTCWPQAYTRPRRESPFRAACDLSGCPKLQSSGVNLGFPFFSISSSRKGTRESSRKLPRKLR